MSVIHFVGKKSAKMRRNPGCAQNIECQIKTSSGNNKMGNI